ncbi:uncharacterized protein [Diadema setosum]|uniref:uncharacterized protein n=1 Tax=Diadema setosum TaxID=31175 RepID=UPI003B3BB246
MPKRLYTEESLQEALKRVRLGELSQRQASVQYGIPRSTIFDKLSGRRPEEYCKLGRAPYLTPAEEDRLAQWAIQMSRIGYGRTREQIMKMAQTIVTAEGRETPFTDNKPGKKWFAHFMKRNPTLSLRNPQGLGIERAVLTCDKLDRWYNGLHDFLKAENAMSILECPHRIWNADESGFALSPKGERVLGMKGAKFVYSLASTTKTNLTTLVAASASGNFCPPFVIYPGQRVSRNWKPLEGAPESWFYGFSKSGWMNAELFYSWLSNHFYPYLVSQNIHFPVLLLVDGHTSHVDLHVGEFCAEREIILYRLQSHSSHVTQPLDLAVFGPLKKAYKKEETAWKDQHVGQFVSKSVFASIFAKAWNQIKPEYAKAGFKAAGLYPFTKKYDRNKLGPSNIFASMRISDDSKPSSVSSSESQTEGSSSSSTSSVAQTTDPTIDQKPITVSIATQTVDTTAESIVFPDPRRLPAGVNNRRPDDFVGPSLEKYLVYPEAERSTQRKGMGEELPKALSGQVWIAYQKRRKEEQQAEEERKQKRREERESNKAARELLKAAKELNKGAGAGKKAAKIKKRDDFIEEDVCAECGGHFDNSDAQWVGCSHCPRWYHVECTNLSSMTMEEIEEVEFTCNACQNQ